MTRHPSLAARLVMAALVMTSAASYAAPSRAADPVVAPVVAPVATDTVAAVAPTDPAMVADPVTKGPVTTLPLPRFVSIKSTTVYARRGPSTTHRIDWIYRQNGLPVEIIAEYGHWRRIRDRDGEGGWVHYALLSGTRTVIVNHDMLDLRNRASDEAPVVARLQTGVIARLEECTPGWCRMIAGGYRGWAPKSAVWGVRAAEIRD